MFPKKILVGYQQRGDTYSGKLAYVVYKDQTGTVRKQKSWEQWRDKKIAVDEYDNVPMSGFVLNKHVGGHKSGWDFRQSYCRVYDPRGFEIEISISNLLYILEWCDCYHGKGLEGEFVYVWDYTDIWLEPVCTEEYKKLKAEQAELFKNVADLELVPGTEYKLKRSEVINKSANTSDSTVIYVGKVNVDKCFGQFKSEMDMFIPGSQANQCGEKDEVFFTFKTMENLSEVVKENAIDYASCCDLIDRFNKSAYSHEFWNNPKNIKRFFAEDVNLYNNPELAPFLDRYHGCFQVDANGNYVTVHVPVVTTREANRYKSYYGRYEDEFKFKWGDDGKSIGGMALGSITKKLFPVVSETTSWGGVYTKQPGITANLYQHLDDSVMNEDGSFKILKCMLPHTKQYKKLANYESATFKNAYCDGKYMTDYIIEGAYKASFENTSDCWYETTDGYVSDSLTRLNVLNHLAIQDQFHIATVMTLPFKK